MNSTALRARRHRAILDLVRSRPIASQRALAEALTKRGHRVTQATLSRDLKELRVLRVPQASGYRYLPAGEAPDLSGHHESLSLGRIAAAEVMALSSNEVCVVVHTQAGRAQGVAAYLDATRVPDVLATVAGDDTVLVIPTSVKRTPALARSLDDLFELTSGASRGPASRRHIR